METLWPLEAAAFVAAAPLFRTTRRGDGHPVLVLPGFTADDASTVALRWSIRGQGYSTHPWRLGRNLGPTEAIMTGVRARLRELAERHRRAVSIVGWSLGGTYARTLGRECPDLVRQVISLGSPYRMVEGDKSSATALWKRYEHLHDADVDLNRIAEQERPRLTVPATSVYSRRDGVTRWQTCIDEVGPLAENIEVYSSHASLGAHPGGHVRCARPVAASRGSVAPVSRTLRVAAVVSTPRLVEARTWPKRGSSPCESPRPAWPGNAMMDMSPMRATRRQRGAATTACVAGNAMMAVSRCDGRGPASTARAARA